MSILLAAFIVCGTANTPAPESVPVRICNAVVFHSVNIDLDKCHTLAKAEALQAENNLLKAGFRNTDTTSFCAAPGSDSMQDETLYYRMKHELRAEGRGLMRYTFNGVKFVLTSKSKR